MQTEPPGSAGERLLIALSGGTETADDLAVVWRGLRLWVKSGCTVPAQYFLPLPKTPEKLKIATRDLWIHQAASHLPSAKPFATANSIHEEMRIFVTRGPWLIWHGLDSPPEGTSELRTSIFFAVRFNDGQYLSERQIYRILTKN